MNEVNMPKKSSIILKAAVVPIAAFAAWELINVIVQYASLYIISFYMAAKNQNVEEQAIFDVFVKYMPVYYVIAVGIMLLSFYFLNRKFRLTRVVRIHTRKIGAPIVLSSAAFGIFVGVLMNLLLNLLSTRIPESWMEANQDSIGTFYTSGILLALISTVLLAPIIEELLFRGFLYNGLKTILHALPKQVTPAVHKITIVLSAVITSVLFGAYHGNILQAIYAGLLSFILIWVYEITGSMISNILFHAAFNFSDVFANMIYEKYGMYLGLIISAVLCAAFAVLLVACSKKMRKTDLLT